MGNSKRALLTITAALAVVFATACTRSVKSQLARAERYAQANRPAAALALYDSALSLAPAGQRALQARIQVLRGEALWRLGRPGEALTAFQKAVEADNNSRPARLRLGELYLAGGAAENAIAQARRMLELDADNADAWALLGAASGVAGHAREAEQALIEALRREPARAAASVALAEIYDRQERVEEARKVLRDAAAASPKSALPLLALARLEEQEADVEAAEKAYREALARQETPETNLRLAQFLVRCGRVQEAQQALRKVDAMQPEQPTATADFELLAGRPENAARHYAAALRPGSAAAVAARLVEAELATADSEAPSAVALERARSQLQRFRTQLDAASVAVLQSEIALAAGDVQQARRQAESAVALAPDSAAAHYALGAACDRGGDAAAARVEWQAAIAQDDDFVPARLALAEQALGQRDPKAAEEQLVPVVRQEPENLRALLLYARSLGNQGRLGSAASIAQRALALDPHAAAAHVLMGEIALRRRSVGQALVEFQQAALLDRRSSAGIDGLVRVFRLGEVRRPMLLAMEKTASRPPVSPTLLELAGRLFAEHGWQEDAQRCLRRAVEADPQRVTAAASLAESYARTGVPAAALAPLAATDGAAAHLLAALSAEQRGDVATAVREYEELVRSGERTGVAANNLAWIYAQQGRELDRALALARNAHDLRPESAEVLDTLGVIHLKRREYSQSVDSLRAAVRLARRSKAAGREQLVGQITAHLVEARRLTGQATAAPLR